MSLELTRIGMQIRSIAALKLHNPGEGRVSTEFERHDTNDVDFEELAAQARESDIDFDELRSNIVATLHRVQAPATIAQVLDEHPATQGLASIVGLMVLGAEHGHTSAEDTERVTLDRRAVTLPTITFRPGDFEDHR